MPFQAELYAVVPEDLTRMVACYRPMGFLDHPRTSPTTNRAAFPARLVPSASNRRINSKL